MPDPAIQRKRKRPDNETTAPAVDGNSSSSDDENHHEEQVVDPPRQRGPSSPNQPPDDSSTTTTATDLVSPSSPPRALPKTPQAREGGSWRVKLYRLNSDGSWDDCGTGRINCVYRNSSSKSNNAADDAPNGESTIASRETGTNNTATPTASAPDEWLYHETGQATLVVMAEPVKATAAAVSSSSDDHSTASRLLLCSRILLRDAYQRQGDNIITWCEPSFVLQQQQHHHHGKAPVAEAKTTTAKAANGNDDSNNNNSSNNTTTTSVTKGVDLALSFQDNEGCLDIWHHIQQVQTRAANMLQSRSVQDLAAQVAAQHHADLCQKQERDLRLWNSNSNSSHDNGGVGGENHMNNDNDDDGNNNNRRKIDVHDGPALDMDASIPASAAVAASSHSSWAAAAAANEAAASCLYPPLPRPPTLTNLEDVADTIATLQHVQQRENLAMFIAQDDCAYLNELLALFPPAEARSDYTKLATLASCVKTILLLNEPGILELVVTDATLFEQVCACLEYDPDLREKANHRWFLRERARFRTVVPMEDRDLVAAIHRSFRVTYLKDTLLRPTMDESSLTTLASLQTFAHADIVKGVTVAPGTELEGGSLYDSYLIRVIDMLCVEVHAISVMEWTSLGARQSSELERNSFGIDPSIVFDKQGIGASHTKQYLAPQDGSLASRKMRRRGCLLFLKELFSMVRMSLQQSDKDDFFSVICTLDIDLNEGREPADNASQTSQQVEVGSIASTARSDRLDEKSELTDAVNIDIHAIPPPTNLLSMLGNVLADFGSDSSEKYAVLDILAGVAMHDASLIRRHCLNFCAMRAKRLHAKDGAIKEISSRPSPNGRNQILFICPPGDLLMAMLFIVAVERDAGMLLQASEILRIVLDTDMMNDHCPLNADFNEAEGVLPGHVGQPHQQFQAYSQHGGTAGGLGIPTGTNEKQFLSVFYEHFAEWLIAPFQFQVLYPVHPVPAHVIWDPSQSELMQDQILAPFRNGLPTDAAYVSVVVDCSIRRSFAVELLSFCVRAHTYRMKFFLLRSKVIGSILNLLGGNPERGIPTSRALKLAVLRFLRAIISANDEFYHRHIVQNDLFATVFEALRINPVNDNLLSSAIVEMCDYIRNERIVSLIEYIVNSYLTQGGDSCDSREDVASPYVRTLADLHKNYKASLDTLKRPEIHRQFNADAAENPPTSPRNLQSACQLSGKALEDQRRFREHDEEESYFDSDDDFEQMHKGRSPGLHLNAVALERQESNENELHRTPRMFSLAQAPLLLSSENQMASVIPVSTSLAMQREESDNSGHSPPTI